MAIHKPPECSHTRHWGNRSPLWTTSRIWFSDISLSLFRSGLFYELFNILRSQLNNHLCCFNGKHISPYAPYPTITNWDEIPRDFTTHPKEPLSWNLRGSFSVREEMKVTTRFPPTQLLIILCYVPKPGKYIFTAFIKLICHSQHCHEKIKIHQISGICCNVAKKKNIWWAYIHSPYAIFVFSRDI